MPTAMELRCGVIRGGVDVGYVPEWAPSPCRWHPCGFRGREGKDSDSRPGNDGGGCREGDAASGGLSVHDCEGQSRRHVISRRTCVFAALGCAVSRLRGPRRDPFGVCQRGIIVVFCRATKRIFALRRRRPERDCPLHAANDGATLRLLTRGYRGVSPAHGSLRTRGFQGRAGGFCAFREKWARDGEIFAPCRNGTSDLATQHLNN